MKDENAIALDFLEHGHPGGKSIPLAQVIGKKHYNLLEVALRDDVFLKAGEEVYIGSGNREKVKYVKGKITGDDLTGNARSELEYVLKTLVEDNEDQFMEFFNESSPITPRMHALELLPGVGKKHMWEIIEERDKEDFESYEGMKERVDLLPNPQKMLVKRLKNELEGDVKHYLFISPPKDSGGKRYS